MIQTKIGAHLGFLHKFHSIQIITSLIIFILSEFKMCNLQTKLVQHKGISQQEDLKNILNKCLIEFQ